MSDDRPHPRQLGRYELVSKLATGGMAELFLARELGLAGLERLVAVKQILPDLADDPSFVDMFLREARIIARLNHPNVVQIFELGEEDGAYFIAMEYIHGSTVRELQILADRHDVDVPIGVAVTIVDQACQGLHAAHEARDLEGKPIALIHRDVSPHNLMCTTEGYVKVLDFGVAKATEGLEATHSGRLKGKFAYMSPEQCKNKTLDRRADVFALGVVLWEMLAGRRLFKRDKDLDMMRAIVQHHVEPPSRFNPAVPPAIDDIVRRALAKDRDQRYQTAADLRTALRDAARRSDLTFGGDVLAEFLERIAGDELAGRRATMHDAMERSLTSNELRNLIHVTGSQSRSEVTETSANREQPTVVERPGAPGEPADRSAPAGNSSPPDNSPPETRRSPSASGSLPPGIHPFEEPDSDDTPSEDGHPAVPGQHTLDQQTLGQQASSVSQSTPGVGDRHTDIGRDVGGADADAGATWPWLAAIAVVLAAACVLVIPSLQHALFGRRLFSDPAAHTPVLMGDPIRMGWAPIATPKVLRDEIKPIDAYLERELGRPVDMAVTDSYQQLGAGLRDGTFDVGMLPPYLYVQTKQAAPDIELVALRQFGGSTSSDALLLTRMTSQARTFADLAGQTFCFTDRDSTTGYFLPRAYIRSRGFELDTFIGDIVWSGNHLQALRDLLAGKCEAAATYSGSFLTAGKFGVAVGKIRQLAITGHVPQDAVVASADTSEAVVDDLRQALLDYDPRADSGVDQVGDVLQITGFSTADDSAYDELRDAVYKDSAVNQNSSADHNSP